MRASLALLILCAALLGCPAESGGDPGSGQDGGMQLGAASGAQPSTRLCDAHLTWDMACAKLEPEPRQDPYWGETECLMGPWRQVQAAYLDAAVECFASLSCEQSDDTCTAAGLAALGIEDETDLAGDALVQRCLELAASCQALLDDNCLFLAVFTPSGRGAAEACLDLPCDAIEGCLLDPG